MRDCFNRCICAVLITTTVTGCSTMISYRAQPTSELQTLRYVQGVGTVAIKNPDHELFMYPTFKTQGPSQPTFTIGYANNSEAPANFSTDNIRAYFRGTPVPIYTYTEKIEEIQRENNGKQLALALLGAVAAGAAAYSASHQTYQSSYSGSVWSGRRNVGFAGTNTLNVYDPASGILAGAAVGGATGVGVQQLEYNAKNQEQAAASILQDNTVEPQRMVTGDVILRDCCDRFAGPNDVIRFEVTANNKVSVFHFARVRPGDSTPVAPTPAVQTLATAAPIASRPIAPAVSPVQLVPTVATTAAPPTAPQQVAIVAPTPAVTPAVAEVGKVRIGQDEFNAARLAKSQSCTDQPAAKLVAKGPGFESYAVACTNGDALAIRCEFGNCRVLR